MNIIDKTYDSLHKLRLEIKDETLREKIEDIALLLDVEFDLIEFINKDNAFEILKAVIAYIPGNFKVIEIKDIQTESELQEQFESVQSDLKIEVL